MTSTDTFKSMKSAFALKAVKLLGITLIAAMLLAVMPGHADDDMLTPVVLFPGWASMVLEVEIDGQTAFPECPGSGTLEWVGGNFSDYPGFGQVCVDKYLTLVIDPDRSKPLSERISNQDGVLVSIKDYGSTESVLYWLYEPMFSVLEGAGYERNINIRVAGYDPRLSPDMDGFLKRTITLIEETYNENAGRPVHLVAYCTGNIQAQYLLTHTSQAWKNKFIHGFTAIGGNWPGQASIYQQLFTGLNVSNFESPTDPENAASSAAMYQTWPSTYLVAPDPFFFKKEVVVIGVQGGEQYTALNYRQLFRDAGMPLARELADYYIGLVKFRTPQFYPNVDVYAEIGTNIPTVVGVELKELKVGTVVDNVTNFFLREGDGVLDDIANESILVWEEMRDYHFELNVNPFVHHFYLPTDQAILMRLLYHLQ
jgi:lecithin-cholesterol acyltransferase